MEEEFNYKTLRKIQQLEKSSPLFSKIDRNFYQECHKHIKDLEQSEKQDESSLKNKELTEEIQNLKKIVNNIYELREKKIVQAALIKARDGSPDTKNLIDIEAKLFSSLVELINSSRDNLFEKKQEKKEIVEEKKENKTEDKVENKNPIIRVTETIPEFVGTDMKNYNLRKDDVLSISKDMSDTLTKRGVAKQIK